MSAYFSLGRQKNRPPRWKRGAHGTPISLEPTPNAANSVDISEHLNVVRRRNHCQRCNEQLWASISLQFEKMHTGSGFRLIDASIPSHPFQVIVPNQNSTIDWTARNSTQYEAKRFWCPHINFWSFSSSGVSFSFLKFPISHYTTRFLGTTALTPNHRARFGVTESHTCSLEPLQSKRAGRSKTKEELGLLAMTIWAFKKRFRDLRLSFLRNEEAGRVQWYQRNLSRSSIFACWSPDVYFGQKGARHRPQRTKATKGIFAYLLALAGGTFEPRALLQRLPKVESEA
jgi:hypothetical protein